MHRRQSPRTVRDAVVSTMPMRRIVMSSVRKMAAEDLARTMRRYISRPVAHMTMIFLLGVCIKILVVANSIVIVGSLLFWIPFICIVVIVSLILYIENQPKNFDRAISFICKKNRIRNFTAAFLPFIVSPAFPSPEPATDTDSESMFEFLQRRIAKDYKRYKEALLSRSMVRGTQGLVLLFIICLGARYILGVDYDTVFIGLVTFVSGFILTVVLTGSVSYVLAYFGYLSVWDRTTKAEVGELKECAFLVLRNMQNSEVNCGFMIHMYCGSVYAVAWDIIDDSETISMEINFHINEDGSCPMNMNEEILEMRRILEIYSSDWWDHRLVIKDFGREINGGMFSYSIGKNKTVRALVRIDEIDGNHRYGMKCMLEKIYMLKKESMENRESEWRRIRSNHELQHYDADSYD